MTSIMQSNDIDELCAVHEQQAKSFYCNKVFVVIQAVNHSGAFQKVSNRYAYDLPSACPGTLK